MRNVSRQILTCVCGILAAACLTACTRTAALRRESMPELQFEPWTGPLRFVPECDWDALLAFARQDPKAREVLNSVLGTGRSIPDKPIIKRVYRLEDIPEKMRDKRGEIRDENAELFCLAKADLVNATRAQIRMPFLALTILATDDQQCLDFLAEQLREMTTWHPLQRPGWSLRTPGRTLPEGGDGNWLSTGHGMWCIVETLAMVGDRLPPDLVVDLKQLVRKEMDSILDTPGGRPKPCSVQPGPRRDSGIAVSRISPLWPSSTTGTSTCLCRGGTWSMPTTVGATGPVTVRQSPSSLRHCWRWTVTRRGWLSMLSGGGRKACWVWSTRTDCHPPV